MKFNGTGPAKNLKDVENNIETYRSYFKSINSPLGYFPALYDKVAEKIDAAIQNKDFENNDLLQKVDIIFVNRYLAAMDAIVQGEKPSQSWQIAAEAAKIQSPIVLQHLMIGMNAHINLDLSVAVAQACKGTDIHAFRSDFEKVNEILLSLLANVEDNLAEIFPPLRFFDKVFGKLEDKTIGFSMKGVREIAWDRAIHFSRCTDEEAFKASLNEQDLVVANLGKRILYPHFGLTKIGLSLVRYFEKGDVAYKIDQLSVNS